MQLGGLCPGGSLFRGGSLSRSGSLSGGSLSRGWSLSRGVSVWGYLSGGGVPCDVYHNAFYVTCLLSLHQLRFNTNAAAYIVLLSHVTIDITESDIMETPLNRQTDVKILPCPKLPLRAVKIPRMVKTCVLPVSPFCDNVQKSDGYDEEESTSLKL